MNSQPINQFTFSDGINDMACKIKVNRSHGAKHFGNYTHASATYLFIRTCTFYLYILAIVLALSGDD